jgi:D-tagatose-1,6-bisphosphate aldolase subunit GatZ/KbaZ
MKKFCNALPLLELVQAQKRYENSGIYSICSANPYVIKASINQAKLDNSVLLIESTSNQVNQFGGYTGMQPANFARFVSDIAEEMQFPTERIILGGDHLGPNPWQNDIAETAMGKSADLIVDSIKAGYQKIHIDASMSCSDDPSSTLAPELIARRTAELCKKAEESVNQNYLPVYVIGTEVPVPGGEKAQTEGPIVTDPQKAKDTISMFQEQFTKTGIQKAWQRVIALVVQPGVEFNDSKVYDYSRINARPLSRMIEEVPRIIFEAHSTDYQIPSHLKEMVEDHFAILKVGPALTFTFREAVFSLAEINNALPQSKKVAIREIIDGVMMKQPKYWEPYYYGTKEEKAFSRNFSLSDRIRYYWSAPEIAHGLSDLFASLSSQEIPHSLISQYFPDLFPDIINGKLSSDPEAMILARVQKQINIYAKACNLA